MRRALCVSYVFHDRAIRPRGILPRLPALGIDPLVVSHRIDEVPPPLGPESCVVVPEPGYAWLREMAWKMPRRRPGGGSSASVAFPPAGGPRHRRWEWRLLFPDRNLLWILPASLAGVRAGRAAGIDVVYASAWPVSSLFAGWMISTILRRPLVVEFRDLWVDNPFLPERPAARLRLERFWERRLVRAAKRVIVVTEPMKRILLEAHPSLDSARVEVIPNGFDPSFAALPGPGGGPRSREGPAVLLYTGALYGHRNPSRLLEALQRLNAAGTRVRLRLIGEIAPEFEPVLTAPRQAGWCETPGSISYAASLEEMAGADALLLLIESGPGSDGIMTGKLFAYLASGRPVLAVAPRAGVAAELVRRTGGGVVLDPGDMPGLEGALLALAERRLPEPDPPRVARELEAYAWPRLAERVATLLHAVIDDSARKGDTSTGTRGRP